jgi:hypothetical protein
MALPDGITTCTVTAGVPVTHTGGPVKAFVSIEPSVFLVHTATGTPLVDFLEELSINEGVAGQFTLPHTDQAGFQDENGNAYTNWYYTARISYSTVSKAKTKAPKIKVFQLAAGQTLVDLDQLPGGAPALPYTAPIATVTSFAGRTGPVELLDGDLPARLSDASLSDTYAPKSVEVEVARASSFGAPQHEDGALYTYPTRLNFGAVEPASRVISPPPSRGIDLIAHWYNDFGLEHTASAAGQANGAYAWYDWKWNFPTNTGNGTTTFGYDPQRHPLQGFYQGDNAGVLDWQSKWLAESGINAASMVASDGADPTTWATPSDTYHWMYQLFENSPNFKALRWLMWLKHGDSGDYNAAYVPGDGLHAVEQQWEKLIPLFASYPNAYLWNEGGNVYPVFYIWDGELLRGAWDNYSGATKTAAALKWLADEMKALGYGGIMVMARNATSNAIMNRSTLRDNGVIYVSAGYSDTYTTGLTSFADYPEAAAFPTALDNVPVVQTSCDTQYPHPSGFNLPGSTPELFGKALRRAVRSIVKNKQRRVLLINNVSEWAESGPGLLPNVQDRFGYLDQVRALPALPTPIGAVGVVPDGLVERVTTTANATSAGVSVPSWARRIEVRIVGASNIAQSVRMQINGDTGANYDSEQLAVSAATSTASESFAQTNAAVGSITDSSARKAFTVVQLENHASGLHRAWMSDTSAYTGTSTGLMTRGIRAGGWRNSAQITSLTFLLTSGYFRDGSIVELYCWR